uniref:Uncharacterized protein n=1 Tax=Nelumbo nucifera TaxID=4432 RepID=A0A822XJZ8_NELNU|nr:TPA_asm: hypothetical protein HUJ06_022090 [Nelumbo nucifera]
MILKLLSINHGCGNSKLARQALLDSRSSFDSPRVPEVGQSLKSGNYSNDESEASTEILQVANQGEEEGIIMGLDPGQAILNAEFNADPNPIIHN